MMCQKKNGKFDISETIASQMLGAPVSGSLRENLFVPEDPSKNLWDTLSLNNSLLVKLSTHNVSELSEQLLHLIPQLKRHISNWPPNALSHTTLQEQPLKTANFYLSNIPTFLTL